MALLEIGPHLVKRLRDTTSAKKVVGEESLAGVLARAQTTGSIYVVLHSYLPLSNDGGGVTRWREVWLVVVVIKHVGQSDAPQEMRTDAAKLLAEVLAALDGWRCPPITLGEVRAVEPPVPRMGDGFGYFSLAFTVDTVSDGCMDSEV